MRLLFIIYAVGLFLVLCNAGFAQSISPFTKIDTTYAVSDKNSHIKGIWYNKEGGVDTTYDDAYYIKPINTIHYYQDGKLVKKDVYQYVYNGLLDRKETYYLFDSSLTFQTQERYARTGLRVVQSYFTTDSINDFYNTRRFVNNKEKDIVRVLGYSGNRHEKNFQLTFEDSGKVIIWFRNKGKNGTRLILKDNHLYEEYDYFTNNRNGFYKKYHPNGAIHVEGRLTYDSIPYDPKKDTSTITGDRLVSSEFEYQYDIPHGIWYYFNTDNKLIKIEKFNKGVLEKRVLY